MHANMYPHLISQIHSNIRTRCKMICHSISCMRAVHLLAELNKYISGMYNISCIHVLVHRTPFQTPVQRSNNVYIVGRHDFELHEWHVFRRYDVTANSTQPWPPMLDIL